MKNGKGLVYPPSGRIVRPGGRAADVEPQGRHYYRIVFFVRREGLALDAGEMEMWFPSPMNGMHHAGAAQMIRERLADQRPDLVEPQVIVVATHRLGFVSDEERERQEHEKAAQAESAKES